jgi:hypothetical protein
MDTSWLPYEAIGLTFILTYAVKQIVYRKFKNRKCKILKWRFKKTNVVWATNLVGGLVLGILSYYMAEDEPSTKQAIWAGVKTVISSAGIYAGLWKHLPWLSGIVEPEKTPDDKD